jgi:hypothetical protein
MALADHQFPRAFAVTLGTPAVDKTPMVLEELQQAPIWAAQMAAQREVGAQPRRELRFSTSELLRGVCAT